MGETGIDESMNESSSACAGCGLAVDRSMPHRCDLERARLSDSNDPMIGKTIGGKYQVIGLLGRGGMSVVYKARQFPIGKIVAFKMLLSHLAGDEASVRRFLQEAKAAGQVNHPNVVNITDFGVSEDKQAYLVMDFLEGESLSDILAERGPLGQAEAIRLFLPVCAGLAAAHEKNVIHRDIKPSNIVLQSVSGERHVKIVDFGIAKMLDLESQQHLTKTGEVFGSPLYMSPEQCEGRALDARSDIYSLGVVFYETLCGQAPLVGFSPLETMRLHMQEMPASLQKMTGIEPVSLALENIIFKMLAKDRDKRYASVLEVKRDLEQVLSGQSNALSGNLQHMGREFSRRARVITLSSVIILALSLAGIMFYPGLCAAVGKQKLLEGKTEFEAGHFDKAETALLASVDLSRKGTDTALENRSLALLAELYRKNGDRERLSQVRKRRQEIIRSELSRLGLEQEFNNLQQAYLKSEPVIVLAPSPQLQAAKTLALDEDSISQLPQSQDSTAALSGATNGTVAVIDRKRPQVNVDASAPLIYDSRLPRGGTAADAKKESGPPGARPLDSGGVSGFPAGAGGAGAGNLAGYGGSSSGASLASGEHYYSSEIVQSQLKNKPQLLEKKTELPARRLQPETGDRLDRLIVLTEMLIENESFEKAQKCAENAIDMSRNINGESSAELSMLLSARAWSILNQSNSNPGMAEADAGKALDMASVSNDAEAKLLAFAVSASCGGKDSQANYNNAQDLIKAGTQKSELVSKALSRYEKQAK